MITYEDAFRIAKSRRMDIDRCFEYEKGWSFGSKEDENYVGGYDHAPVNIAKENGKTYQTTYFLMIFNAGEILRGFDVDPETGEPTRELVIDPDSGAVSY